MRVASLEAELAAATRTASQLAAAGEIASRSTQVLSARNGDLEAALTARCEALQARMSLLEAELAAANRAAQEQSARRAEIEELAASQKAAIDLAASSAQAQRSLWRMPDESARQGRSGGKPTRPSSSLARSSGCWRRRQKKARFSCAVRSS